MQALILAGGLGTRLQQISGKLPKTLVSIAGRPILDRQLEQLVSGDCRDIVILTGFSGDQIAAYCGDGARWGARVRCIQETTARGTAGAVLDALDVLDERFFITYGDTVFNVDLQRMAAFHNERLADITLLIHPSDHPQDSDLAEVGPDDIVRCFHPYPHPHHLDIANLTNAGLYRVERDALVSLLGSSDLPEKPDFVKHVFPLLLSRGLRFIGYRSPEYIKDAGTTDRFGKVERDLLSGRVEAGSLRTPAAAVFLDRDGTIIEERDHLATPDEIAMLPGAGGAIARLNRSSYRTAIITNQPVIARGDCDEAGLARIHARLEKLLGADRAYIDRIYYCPHHPTAGFPGERTDLKIACECRKPASGLIENAVKDLHLDLQRSWFIGDSTTDMAAARQAGVRSILVKTGIAGGDGKWPCLPDYECRDLVDAVDLILDRWPRLLSQMRNMHLNIAPNSVLLVGGLARSGKSTVAAVLAEALRDSRIGATVVPLDCFLKGTDENRGATVLDRYDIDAAVTFVREALARPGIRRLPRYDRVLRQSIPDGVAIDIPPHPLLILEGVPALACPELRSLAADSIYVTRPETDRLQAITLDYLWRGWHESQIADLIAVRAADEIPIIESSKTFAGMVLSPANSR
jgi:histidinol-phosphate phosphatase family protein